MDQQTESQMPQRKNTARTFLFVGGGVVVLLFLSWYFFVGESEQTPVVTTRNTPTTAQSKNLKNKFSGDIRRSSDIHVIMNMLTFGGLPTPETCQNNKVGTPGKEGWDALTACLVNRGYVRNIPSDPSGRPYEYRVSKNGYQFVLKAVLDNKDNEILEDDIDDVDFNKPPLNTSGISSPGCDDPAYCIENP
ncbi:MAG: hypothetical protein HZA36_03490 [Parcubacteria group bacterium]|nr:hypothetical protein [Parcubacteria group bacterium]